MLISMQQQHVPAQPRAAVPRSAADFQEACHSLPAPFPLPPTFSKLTTSLSISQSLSTFTALSVQVFQALQPLAQQEVLRFEVARQGALAYQVSSPDHAEAPGEALCRDAAGESSWCWLSPALAGRGRSPAECCLSQAWRWGLCMSGQLAEAQGDGPSGKSAAPDWWWCWYLPLALMDWGWLLCGVQLELGLNSLPHRPA